MRKIKEFCLIDHGVFHAERAPALPKFARKRFAHAVAGVGGTVIEAIRQALNFMQGLGVDISGMEKKISETLWKSMKATPIQCQVGGGFGTDGGYCVAILWKEE